MIANKIRDLARSCIEWDICRKVYEIEAGRLVESCVKNDTDTEGSDGKSEQAQVDRKILGSEFFFFF